MSKPMKEMIIREYRSRFSDVENGALISIRGVSSNDTMQLRSGLRDKSIRVTVLRNALARKAFEGTGLESLGELLEGPNALAYGGESVVDVAREVVKLLEQFPKLELRGAVLDGMVFRGDAGVRELSKFPTRDEAIAEVVTLVLSPARNLMGQVQGPGRRIAGIVKAVEEKLEKGEAIGKAG